MPNSTGIVDFGTYRLATVRTTGQNDKHFGKEGPLGVEGLLRNRRLTLRVSGQQGPPLNVFLGSSELALLISEQAFPRVNDALKLLDLAGFFGNDGKCKEQLAETCDPEQKSVH